MKKIIIDSSGDLRSFAPQPPETEFAVVPLTLQGQREYLDVEGLDTQAMLREMEVWPGKTGSACPSPEDWAKQFRDAEECYAITISSQVSGSYHSAVTARKLVLEEQPEKKIFLLDSYSTGPGMILLVRRLSELLRQGRSYEEICLTMAACRQHTRLLFLLGSLDNLVKNGRCSKVAGLTAQVLNIRVIGRASDRGELQLLRKCRGESRAYETLRQEMEELRYCGGRVVISHCQQLSGAEAVRSLILSRYPHARVDILPTGGLCSYYAQQGGILVGFETLPDD